MQSKSDSVDVYENKRYAIELKSEGKMIGMVGMGEMELLHEVEIAYFLDEVYYHNGYATEAVKALCNWCFDVSDVQYLILAIDKSNTASVNAALNSGFTLFEERKPIGHIQDNMVSDTYFYFRLYRYYLCKVIM